MDIPTRPGSLEDGRLVRRIGIGVFCLSVVVLTGWFLDSTILKSVVPGQVSMKVNTAVGLALVALALRLSGKYAGGPRRDWIALCGALAAVALGAATLAEYWLKVDLGIDEFFFRDSAHAVATSNPGRMAPLTAADFVLLGVSLWLIRRPRAVLVAQVLAVLVIFSALFSLIGYVYHASRFYQLGEFTAMAVHTSTAFLALGVGVLCVRPDYGLMRAISRYRSGGRVMGLLLAGVVALPVTLGWLRVQGELAGFYDPIFGVGLMTIALVCCLAAGIWWASLLLGRADEERERVEHALRAGEARLNFVLQSIQAGGWEMDLTDLTAECTLEHFRIFGYDARLPEWTYPMFLEHVRPEDRPEVDRSFQAATAAQIDLNFECRIRRVDGEERWIWVVGRHQLNTLGQLRRMMGTTQDITERKRIEAAVLQANEQNRDYETLRTLIDHLPGCVYLKDAQGRFLMANRGLAQFFGQEAHASRLVGLRDQDLFAPEMAAGFRADDEAVLAGREVREREETVAFPNGQTRIFLTTKIPFRDSQGNIIGILGTGIDITERQQAEAERQQFESKLQETQKLESLGVLAGGIAHDFNNILTGILGNASLARIELSDTSPLLPNLEQIEQSAHRAAELCRQMLAYAGKGRFLVQRLDLNQLVDGTTRLLNITITKKCVLRFNLAPTLPTIAADATQIRQIIMNLVINASEAIGLRSGVIAISTGVVRVDQDYLSTLLYSEKITLGDYVFVEVSDNGSGMDAAVLGKIFDPFFTTKFTGRGLGLAAVLGIVRGHKGSLKVYSEPGRGTTFKILLPCVDGPADHAIARTKADDRWRGQGTVLIVDDEETVRTVSARIMESLGFSVVLAADGREAVEKYRGEPARYAFVLLDLTMPHMDGEESFRQLRHLNPGVKVVLMSGFNQAEAISRFTGKGLAGFVQKPFEVNDVVIAIRSVMVQT
jgi:PAS domain S-box-containing protein